MKVKYPSIYLINPQLPDSHNGFKGMEKIVRKKWSYMPLVLPTIASITPSCYEVKCCDENVDTVDFDTDCDIIGITGINVQASRAFAIADEFRKRGKVVVIGGGLPSTSPQECLKHADIVFIGEAEETWPQFLRELQEGRHSEIYEAKEKADMSRSPIPRFDTLKQDKYLVHCLQITRGCPFLCEFCDIPGVFGRKPRYKKPEQVVEEVRLLQEAGARHIYFVESNFIGNKRLAKEILRALIEFRKKNKSRTSFSTDLVINVAADKELLELLNAANFTSILIGIESPRIQSLKETHKYQNTARPLIDDIHKIQGYNISIVAAMIQGFDHDDENIFQEQFDFLMEARLPIVSPSILQALPGTPLYARMIREKRIVPGGEDHFYVSSPVNYTNFMPKNLTEEQLVEGNRWLWRILFRYDNFAKRAIESSRLQGSIAGERKLHPWEYLETVMVLLFSLKEFLLVRNVKKRKFFIDILLGVLKQKISWAKLRGALLALWYHRLMREVIIRIYKFGDPELVSNTPEIFSIYNKGVRKSA